MAVLNAAGVTVQARAASVPIAEWAFENQDGELLACLPETGDQSVSPIMITREALHSVCVQTAIKLGVEIHYGKRVSAVTDEVGSPLTVHFADGSTAAGDLLVGADGIRSDVRRIVIPESPKPEYTGMLAPGGFSPCRGDRPPQAQSPERVHFRFGQNGFFGFANVLTGTGPKVLWWSTAAGPLLSREEQAQLSLRDRQARLLKLHEGWAEPVAELIQSSNNIIDVPIHDVPSLPAWSAGRTILIGDAAHAVAPHSGQGASMALEDAMLLGKLIRDCAGQSTDALFSTFEKQRRPRTDKVIAMGRQNAKRKAQLTPFAYWLQQQAIRYMLPLARRRRQRWLLDYRVEW